MFRSNSATVRIERSLHARQSLHRTKGTYTSSVVCRLSQVNVLRQRRSIDDYQSNWHSDNVASLRGYVLEVVGSEAPPSPFSFCYNFLVGKFLVTGTTHTEDILFLVEQPHLVSMGFSSSGLLTNQDNLSLRSENNNSKPKQRQQQQILARWLASFQGGGGGGDDNNASTNVKLALTPLNNFEDGIDAAA